MKICPQVNFLSKYAKNVVKYKINYQKIAQDF